MGERAWERWGISMGEREITWVRERERAQERGHGRESIGK